MNTIDMHTVTMPQLREAQRWVLDCVWADLDDESVAELTGEQIVKGVQRHYEGGWAAFVRDCCLEPQSSVQDVMAQHHGHSVHVGGAWSTAITTVDAKQPSDKLRWQYEGYAVDCLTCGTKLSQQWNA